MMEIRVGDRYLVHHSQRIWEVVEIVDLDIYDLLCITEGSKFEKIEQFSVYTLKDTTVIEYLGNFAKVDKFQELYNLLNS